MAEQNPNSERPEPVALCILDGWGLREETAANAIALAQTPVYDRMRAELPMTTLSASGEAVGLPPGQMGNSEVGHMTIGAGRVIDTDLRRIDRAIDNGEFAANPSLQRFIAALRASGGVAHLTGLASDGGVHSHQRHMIETARVLASAGLEVRLHLFLDGRDTLPKSAERYVAKIEADLANCATVRIATVIGRFFALDRDNRWERVRRAWAAMTLGPESLDPTDLVGSARQAVAQSYAAGETDEFVAPKIIAGHSGIADGDGLFVVNFRADRIIELMTAFLEPDFTEFDRDRAPKFAAVIGMTHYSDALAPRMMTMFPPTDIRHPLGPWVARHGMTQLRVAETEKYPHVTYFLNGGVEEISEGEHRHMPPSPKVATYDLAPEMAAAAVTESLTNAIHSRSYDLIIANFANPDMVGHSGVLEAAIRAVETVDRAVGAAWQAIEAVSGAMLVTADHGNCEMMMDPETGAPHTAHTTNPVPLFLIGGRGAGLADGGGLRDLAPTLIDLLNLPAPVEMTGDSLLRRPTVIES